MLCSRMQIVLNCMFVNLCMLVDVVVKGLFLTICNIRWSTITLTTSLPSHERKKVCHLSLQQSRVSQQIMSCRIISCAPVLQQKAASQLKLACLNHCLTTLQSAPNWSLLFWIMKSVPSTVPSQCTYVSPHGQLLQLVCGKTISSDANIVMLQNKQMKSERFSMLHHLSGTCLNAWMLICPPMQAQNQFKIGLQISQWFINFGLLCKRAAKKLSHENDQSCDRFITNMTTKKRLHEEQNVKSINTNCVSFLKMLTNVKTRTIRIRGHSQNVHKWCLFFAKVH